MNTIPEEFMPLCPICQISLADDTFAVICGHTFHESCISAWRKKPNCDFCPICRKDLKGTEAKKLFFEFQFPNSSTLEPNESEKIESLDPEELKKTIQQENSKVLDRFKGVKVGKNIKDLREKLANNTEQLSKMKHLAVEVTKARVVKGELQSKINEMQLELNLKIQELKEKEEFLEKNKVVVNNLENLEREREYLMKELFYEDVMRRDRRAEEKTSKKKGGIFRKLFGGLKRKKKIQGPGF